MLENKFVIVRNKLGTAIGVKYNGELLKGVKSIELTYAANAAPIVQITFLSQDVSFEDIATMGVNPRISPEELAKESK